METILMRSIIPTLIILSLTFPALNAQADPLPTRKAGLWEISITSDRNADHPMKMKQCTDEETDKKMLQMGADMQGRATCSKNETTRTSNGSTANQVANTAHLMDLLNTESKSRRMSTLEDQRIIDLLSFLRTPIRAPRSIRKVSQI